MSLLFNTPTDESAELAGPMPTDRLVAVCPLQRNPIRVTTSYGENDVLRCEVVDIATRTKGTRLLFWTTAQKTVLDATITAPYALGTFVERPQAKDPSRSVYLFLPPDMSELDIADVEEAILTASPVSPGEEAPF